MEEEGKAIIAILRTLALRGHKDYNETGRQFGVDLPKKNLNSKLQVLIRAQRILYERDIIDMAKNPTRQQFPQNTFIPLEPSNYASDGSAFLWCRWDLDGSGACGFYYGYFCMGQRHQVEGEKAVGQVLQFTGYRYETPNSQGLEHRFFHAQPTTSMDPAQNAIASALPYRTDAPTFPLPVTTRVGLLLCLVLSVLGKSRLNEIIGELQLSRPTQRNRYLNDGIIEVQAIAA